MNNTLSTVPTAAQDTEQQRSPADFESSHEPAMITDSYGLIRAANPAVAHLLNILPDFLVGKPLAVFVHPLNVKAFRIGLAHLHLREPMRTFDIGLTPRPGRATFGLTVTARRIRDPQTQEKLRNPRTASKQ